MKKVPASQPSSPPATQSPKPMYSRLFGALGEIEDAKLSLHLWADQSFKFLGDIEGIENHPVSDFLCLNAPHFYSLLERCDQGHDAACELVAEIRDGGRNVAPAASAGLPPATDGLVNFRLPEEHHARLTEMARNQGASVDSLVRVAVEKHLVRLESAPPSPGGGITFEHLSELDRAVMGFTAFADGIKAQLGELISRTGDDNEVLNDQLNALFWNFDHSFGIVQKNANAHVSALFVARRDEDDLQRRGNL